MPRAVVVALLALLALDASLVALHVVRDPDAAGSLGDPRLSLGRELGYGEILGYAQLALASGLMLLLHRRRRQPVYLAWAVVLTTVMADDALTLHEAGGRSRRLPRWC
jgi:hypothetical protein